MRQSHLLFIDLLVIAVALVSAVVLRDSFEVSVPRMGEITSYFLCTLAAADRHTGAPVHVAHGDRVPDQLRVLSLFGATQREIAM